MDDDRLLDVLQDIGLTEYQSRAYVAAVKLGSTRFSALSDEAGIPQQRIYDVVDDLQALGLVEVHEASKGKEAVAIQPETGLNELKEQRFSEYASSVDTAVASLEQQYQGTDSSQGFLTVVNHESSVKRHVRSAIEDAEWWLFLSLPRTWFESMIDAVEDATDRGVTVRLVIQSDEPDAIEDADYPVGMEVRYRPGADMVVAADREYGVFRGIAAPSVERPSMVTWDENIVEMLHRYTEQFWVPSRHVYGERPFPRRYLDPWSVITDLADGFADDEAYVAYVEGHDTSTGSSGTWEGEVIDTTMDAGQTVDSSLGLPEVARITIEVDGEPLTVGGWDATLEDVAAHGIEIRRG